MRSRRSSRISLRNKFCVFPKCYVGYQCSCIKKKQTDKPQNNTTCVFSEKVGYRVTLAARMLQMSAPVAKSVEVLIVSSVRNKFRM